MDFWQLPGPSAFIRSVGDAISKGSNIVIACSSVDEVTIARMIDGCDGWSLPVRRCEVSGQPPVDDVFETLGIDERVPSKRTIAALIERMPERLRVVVDPIRPEGFADWLAFANEYESACRVVSAFDRTQFVFLVSGVPKSQLPSRAPALDVFVWDGWIGEADIVSYIAWHGRRKGHRFDARAKLCARIIARLAMWDFLLVDELMALPTTTILSQGAWQSEIGCGRGSSLPLSWEGGGTGEFDGESYVHSLVLAAQGDLKGELVMRLWAAQASELLPLLELRRRKLVERMKALSGLPARLELDGAVINELEDEEISVISRIAEAYRLPNSIRGEARGLRWLRNRLAHFQPVSLDEALVVLEGGR